MMSFLSFDANNNHILLSMPVFSLSSLFFLFSFFLSLSLSLFLSPLYQSLHGWFQRMVPKDQVKSSKGHLCGLPEMRGSPLPTELLIRHLKSRM